MIAKGTNVCCTLDTLHTCTYGTGSMDLSTKFHFSAFFIETEEKTSTVKFIMLIVLNMLGFIRICCILMKCCTPNLPIFPKKCMPGENLPFELL